MSRAQTILGPILNPRADGTVEFFPEGAITCEEAGAITYVGDASARPSSLTPPRRSGGILCPPFLDAHIHIPQHPIRGHFMDGVGADPPEGRLLAGLNRNVFPTEARCSNREVTEQIVRDFAVDTLAHGVVGGAAYMTIHPEATDIALSRLGEYWSLGLVLMEMNCPPYLRVGKTAVEQMRNLAGRYGNRYVVTDRFAVSVGSELRSQAARVAGEFGLRMQTHLNEQLREKAFVEEKLYPDARSYTDVYHRDGLLDRQPILAHCIHMRPDEWELVARASAVVAHCPTSNTLLCSGTMPLDQLHGRGIDYAVCTDVGASPTTSILAEMAQYLKVHAGRSDGASPSQALFRATCAPARILGLAKQLGTFAVGMPMSFVEIVAGAGPYASADDAISRGLLEMSKDHERGEYQSALAELATGTMDAGSSLNLLEADVRETARRLEEKVLAVTLNGEEIFRRD